jgi:hypothetical protein
MKLACAVAFALAGVAVASPCCAVESAPVATSKSLLRADWQVPQDLPRRFRNHCRFENFTGRLYCSNHCGIDYQFYYCSENSFGCCHFGRGYCDFRGALRCHL